MPRLAQIQIQTQSGVLPPLPPTFSFLRPGADCHAMAAGLKAGGFFTFIDKLDENLCEMCVRDLWPGYTLSFECSSLFIFCWVFWGHKKGTFTSVSAVLGLGVAQDTAFFFRSCCLCLLFPPRAT